ncbi:unnamed protein product [Meloidogyne enterolobii]|uniref:Uncharacterized protein n=1 Tax=Meloidogyne enterolobii TaxID=390850 RepID=A0ACB0ZL85_MELEN
MVLWIGFFFWEGGGFSFWCGFFVGVFDGFLGFLFFDGVLGVFCFVFRGFLFFSFLCLFSF